MAKTSPSHTAAATQAPFEFEGQDISVTKLLLDPNNYRFLDRRKFKKKAANRSHEESVQRATLESLEQKLRNCAHIVECFSIAGSSDYVCRIVVESIAAYEIFLKKTLLHMPGVSEVQSQVALKRVKLITQLPL